MIFDMIADFFSTEQKWSLFTRVLYSTPYIVRYSNNSSKSRVLYSTFWLEEAKSSFCS